MANQGWKQLLAGGARATRTSCEIAAYSEFMPPPRVGCKPYGAIDTLLFQEEDPWGWHVTEYEQSFELDPGLRLLAKELLGALRHLGRREPAHGIAQNKLQDNPYWPDELRKAGAPASEHYVSLMPLALARTQDDKGRVRWTLFGGSEQGPSRGFWRSFFSDPKTERPADEGLGFLRHLLHSVYGEHRPALDDLVKAGLRILPCTDGAPQPLWHDDRLPSWTAPLLLRKGRSLAGVKYLLTFCPFGTLPAAVRKAYLAGALHLLPFPGSLVFWGAAPYLRLAQDLPLAAQIPLLHSAERHAAPIGIRVPQSGWLHEPRPGAPAQSGLQGPLRNTYRRTHRWARVHRDDDELAVSAAEDKVAHVLFSTAADDLGLYGKPMARNSQLWTRDCQRLLDGPRAQRSELMKAARMLAGGGLFGYRFQFPAMLAGDHEVYWHRPLVAWWAADDTDPTVLEGAPLGYLTAYKTQRPNLAKPIELWPRLLERTGHKLAVRLFEGNHEPLSHRRVINIRKLLDTRQLLQGPLEASFARSLLTVAKEQTLDGWLDSLSISGRKTRPVRELVDELRSCVDPSPVATVKPLTFAKTAQRAFEKQYWETIAGLSTGIYINKDNADCVRDAITQSRLAHNHRDLEALGDHLLSYYHDLIAEQEMQGQALAGDLPFRWRTEFDYGWQGGWAENQAGQIEERDLIVVIPGRDRSRAVIMADHYDTAYMEDEYGYGHGGHGPRLSAAGADDNHSATAALMLGAPVFMELSRRGQLDCDIWLVHLTGEEFPADCLGARHLCQGVVERSLRMRLAGTKKTKDLSKVRIQGVYVLDMVAHNNDRDRDVFQICPGASRQSMWLAYQAHVASRTWNELAPTWNQKAARRGRGRGRRSADAITLPAIAEHPYLNGEVRPAYDPRSTLYNTDGQIFSDAGVPVVLFMENYDINRRGYHDTHDTMANIDLDYGAAVAAIAIESVARAASQPPLP
jgi:hypothetical protein